MMNFFPKTILVTLSFMALFTISTLGHSLERRNSACREGSEFRYVPGFLGDCYENCREGYSSYQEGYGTGAEWRCRATTCEEGGVLESRTSSSQCIFPSDTLGAVWTDCAFSTALGLPCPDGWTHSAVCTCVRINCPHRYTYSGTTCYRPRTVEDLPTYRRRRYSLTYNDIL
eukprot:Awhi_evm1s11674